MDADRIVLPAVEDFEEVMRRGGDRAIRTMSRFFMRDDPVHRTLFRITQKLSELEIPYAVVGGMALVAHGYDRSTTDVDILLTAEGLQKAHDALDGLGYLPPFTGSKHLRDTTTGVKVEFLITGQFPGDGKPKPIAFPDPAAAGVEIKGIRYIGLPTLLELKLSSGMTNVGRLKDLGDVQEIIRATKLPRDVGEQLNPFVRSKFFELWDAVDADQTSHDRT